MLSVVNSLFKTYLGRYRKELRMHYDDPPALQAATLESILSRNRSTDFGRDHNFHALFKEPRRYAEAVPVRDYNGHRPYIDRVFAGRRQALTHDPADWVATTSGTTGSVKLLPISDRAVADIHLKGSWLSLAALYEKDESLEVFSSKNLLIGGAYQGLHECGLPQADISAIIIRSIPRVMRPFYIPDVALATHDNYEHKIDRIAHLAAREPGITILGGVPTWNLPLYRRILDIHGGDNMHDVWPEASVFKHGGVAFEPYRAQFEQLFPKPGFIFQEIYNATEGFFGIQDRDELRTMLLTLSNGIYYEFVPFDAFQQSDYRGALPLDEVRERTPYVMVITTEAGLYRYPMGDLIEFTETDPYRIRILGRTQEFINAFGEDLLRNEAESALLEACNRARTQVRDFTVGPSYIGLGNKGCHHWIVEFEHPPADLEGFNTQLDRALQRLNNNYRAKRANDLAITRHELTVAPRGFFREWMRDRGKLGGQHKVPRLANHRRFLEDMLGRL